jgi:hypothetical protein
MERPVPKVTQADIERIVRRDFLADQFDQVMQMLGRYQGDDGDVFRIRADVLKLANRRIELVTVFVDRAILKTGDVINPAEYPAQLKLIRTTSDGLRRAIDEDWRQYEEWLNRE